MTAPGVSATVDLVAGGRVASLVVDGHELLRTTGDGPISWGSFPMAPFAGRIRDGILAFDGATYQLPLGLPPHAIHGTVHERVWALVGESTIATDLGPDWPFRGRAVQRFELGADHLTCRLELHADEPMPASIGWHPYFLRRLDGVADELEVELDAGAMLRARRRGHRHGRHGRARTGSVGRLLHRPPSIAGRSLAGLPGADGRGGLSGLGRLHRPGGRCVRGTPDGATGCAEHGPDGRAAGATPRGRDDLALALARRLTIRISRRSS